MGTHGWAYRRRQPEGTVLYEAVREYLECGVLAHGFARVRCESCKDELLVAFSCKGPGVCPSCNAKRAHVTAVHLMEQVLPHVPYRQWTLSFPHQVRWVLLTAPSGLAAYRLRWSRCVIFVVTMRDPPGHDGAIPVVTLK